MASKNGYHIWWSERPVAFGTGWLVRMERTAFGWEFAQSRVDEGSFETDEERDVPVYDTDGNRIEGVTAKQKYKKTHKTSTRVYRFERIKPYSYNPLFVAAEALCNLYSNIRYWIFAILGQILKFLIIPLIILAVISYEELIDLFSQTWSGLVVGVVVPIFAVFVLPSLLFAGIGVGLRALFGIDKKIETELANAGKKPNWREW